MLSDESRGRPAARGPAVIPRACDRPDRLHRDRSEGLHDRLLCAPAATVLPSPARQLPLPSSVGGGVTQ